MSERAANFLRRLFRRTRRNPQLEMFEGAVERAFARMDAADRRRRERA